MINYIKSETERLEKRIKILETEGDHFDVDLCIEKLSTLIKTSWIFARETGIYLSKYGSIDDEECYLDHHGYCQTHGMCDTPCNNVMMKEFLKELQEIISYCEAKAKEHKIDLEDGE
jgi:hypothetical protein